MSREEIPSEGKRVFKRPPEALRVAVFCSANSLGSHPGLNPEFFAQAKSFAAGLVERRWELIYGGSKNGLMGCFADAALQAGGVVRGAITADLAAQSEMPHPGLTELVIVRDLFERKRWMMEQADAFVVFPGGYGTLDEALEAITWKSLGQHQKPILFFNVEGFWQGQIEVFREFFRYGMIRADGCDLFSTHNSLESVWTVLDAIE